MRATLAFNGLKIVENEKLNEKSFSSQFNTKFQVIGQTAVSSNQILWSSFFLEGINRFHRFFIRRRSARKENF